MRRRLHAKHRRRRAGARLGTAVVLLAVGMVLAAAGAASAFFIESGSGSFGLATAGTIGPPTSFSAVAASSTSVSLSWDAPIDPSPTGYSLSQSPGTLSGCVASPPSGTTTCTATGLTPGTEYTWTLSADYYGWASISTESGAAPPKETPAITSTTSSTSLTVGGSLDDRSVVSGGYGPGGTITWRVYAAGDTNCSGTAYFTSGPQSVDNDSTYTSGAYASDAAGSYIWGFSYSGDASNNPVRGCGGSGDSFTVNEAAPVLSTSASSIVDVGQSVTDTAILSNAYDPTGTITYSLYGPSPTASCANLVGEVTQSVTGDGSYTSSPLTPVEAGTYWWMTDYGGDSNNEATSNTCGQTGESSVVNPVTPDVITAADPASLTYGGSGADQATLSGYGPSGTITFSLYDSSDTACSMPLYTDTQTVNGNSTYTSGSYAPKAGSYIWGFSYSGDNNNYSAEGCGGSTETLTVGPAPTSFEISVNGGPSASTTYGAPVTLAESGLPADATGTVTFSSSTPSAILCSFGYPGSTSCSTSATLAAGNYPNIKATFADTDGNNEGSTSSNSVSLTLSPDQVSLSLSVPITGTVNTAIGTASIGASLTGGTAESGTVGFTVFGPSRSAPGTCSSGGVPVGTATPVSGDATYHPSAEFTPATPGDYWWFASFKDTDGNNSAASSACPPVAETVVTSSGH